MEPHKMKKPALALLAICAGFMAGAYGDPPWQPPPATLQVTQPPVAMPVAPHDVTPQQPGMMQPSSVPSGMPPTVIPPSMFAPPPMAMPVQVPQAKPSYVVPEPTSGLPPGRLVQLPMIPERQIHELALDLAMHLQLTGGYSRLGDPYPPDMAPFPPIVTPDVAVSREKDGARYYVRVGHVLAPRRLPVLWIQGYMVQPTGTVANPDADSTRIDNALKQIVAERVHIFTKLKLTDLETTTIPLSYVDADAALFALRAMGYSVITDTESLQKDDSYKGEEAESYDVARAAEAAQASAQMGQMAQQQQPQMMPGLSPDDMKRFIPKFPAIKNLPTTIGLDRLPLIVRMPSTDPKNMGLVGADMTPAQRDQLGLTVIPSAASPLNEAVTGGSSDLLVIYHPSYPEQVAKLRRIVDETIDRPARQIFIEALVLEISQSGLKDLGVQWDLKRGPQSFSLGSLIPVVPGGSAFSFGRDGSVNITPSQMMLRIQALLNDEKAEVLSRPSVITLDNRQATIRVGTDIPVATSKDASAAGTDSSSRVAFSFQYIPTGILLNVRPRLSDDQQEISLLIDATVSATVPGADLQVLDPTTHLVLASAPTLSTRRVQTYARIRDNQPLIIGGLVSRNQTKSYDRVPVLGSIPFVGALFGHTNTTDDKREVIIVLTPSVVTENIRDVKAQFPKDDERFDQLGNVLFKDHYRIRREDLVDSSDFRFNARFRTDRDIANKVIERKPELANVAPWSLFQGQKVPGEFIFVSGMMYHMLDRLNAGDPIRIENLKFFERGMAPADLRPVSLPQVMARYGDGVSADSFFAKNPGKALALTFTLSRNSMYAGDEFMETVPEVKVVDCPNRDVWRETLWNMSQPNERGIPRFTILINNPSDLRRLQLAFATQNTVLNNGGVQSQVFDRWLPGTMLHLQEVAPNWERIVNAQIAQYFVIGVHYYMYFAQEFTKAQRNLEATFTTPEIQPLLAGMKLPPPN
jgi:general secretion pathway protein D